MTTEPELEGITLKIQKRTTSQGKQTDSINWKSKKTDTPLQPAEGTQPQTPWFQPPGRRVSGLWPQDAWYNECVLFLTTTFVVICCSSYRKWICIDTRITAKLVKVKNDNRGIARAGGKQHITQMETMMLWTGDFKSGNTEAGCRHHTGAAGHALCRQAATALISKVQSEPLQGHFRFSWHRGLSPEFTDWRSPI